MGVQVFTDVQQTFDAFDDFQRMAIIEGLIAGFQPVAGQIVIAADQRGNRPVKADEMGRQLPRLAAFRNEIFTVEQP